MWQWNETGIVNGNHTFNGIENVNGPINETEILNGKQTLIGTEANGNETINGTQTANEIGTGILNGTANETNAFHCCVSILIVDYWLRPA